MNLYKVSSAQASYDEYDSFAVYAENDVQAIEIVINWFQEVSFGSSYQANDTWTADEIPVSPGMVHSSFRAG